MYPACKYLGYSRDTFYRYKELFEEGGEDALKDMNRRIANVKNHTEPHIEERVVSFAIENPAFGQTSVLSLIGCSPTIPIFVYIKDKKTQHSL